MKSLSGIILALVLGGNLPMVCAQEPTEEKAAQEARVKENLAKHAREKGQPKVSEKTASDVDTTESKSDNVTMMEDYVVSNSRISSLDVQIKKLDKKIKRAKKKVKPSDLDNTMNSDDLPKGFLIFGGNTAGQRKSIAADRLHFMEAERDILDAMKFVSTKKEEDELKKQLNAFKTMRRMLDENLR